jgi:hypothetical protein
MNFENVIRVAFLVVAVLFLLILYESTSNGRYGEIAYSEDPNGIPTITVLDTKTGMIYETSIRFTMAINPLNGETQILEVPAIKDSTTD